jgi:hypothetical protein
LLPLAVWLVLTTPLPAVLDPQAGDRLLDAQGREWRVEALCVGPAGTPSVRVVLRFLGEPRGTAFELPVKGFAALARRAGLRPWPG